MTSGLLSRTFGFKAHLHVVAWDGARVFVVGEEQQFLLVGRSYALVAPLLDGRRAVAAIAAALQKELTPSEVVYVVMRLEERGYIADVGETPPTESDVYWSALGLDARKARASFAACPVAVEGARPDATALARALESCGIVVSDDGAVRVIVTHDYLDPSLRDVNQRARAQGHRWLALKPRGTSVWIGPMFGGEGACWECLAARVRHNRPVQTYIARHRPNAAAAPPPAGIEGAVRGAFDGCALSLARWIAEGRRGPLDSSLVVTDAGSLRTRLHRVVRRPQCPTCGDPLLFARRVETPVRLSSAPRRVADDGGYRTVSPDETFARLEHHISPITGVLASVEPLPGRNDPLRPVFAGTYRVCPVTDGPAANDFHRYSLGKGRTVSQARASALCEGIERQSSVMQGDEPRVVARFVDLRGEAIHPDLLQEFSPAQRRASDEAHRGHEGSDVRRAVPPAFDESAAIEWTPGWSLTHERRCWLPLSYCYSHVPAAPAVAYCPFNPNGHAAGNCIEEAIVQGFLELVERDAVGIWWYNRAPRPAVDLATFDEPYFVALESRYSVLGWPLWVLDVTHDLEIPSFVALARAAADGRFSVGFGCHFDARLGVQRALTELNQLFDPEAPRSPWSEHPQRDGGDSFLFPSAAPRRRASDFAAPGPGDIADDVRTCVARAARAGLETLAIDQTRPDVELSVAKVIVPGLRHIWPRLGQGRLYDVPVACGWLQRRLKEDELNPVPLLL